ncbi:major facilitator superfamily domain-containing protein [Lasiosphaeria miniovina]|uniref:Major facilitator superfamily domain-containing protein n=1 Tax=Lasiosphaeria miniovina TaxID=1954250 RepID=A0AA40DV80_9PEZI|nr:major facilitator superfamily domain-containing protein [Lasiosphaeria miniovina]KAK0717604.1 major facilitator superfamily domain-containing protein [Lasiosphaeria miniovina]
MPFKLASAGFSFFVAGVNDGSLGALIPYVIRDYGITTAIVSTLYAASFAGWLTAALTNTHLTQRLGLGTMLGLGAALQTAAQALRTWPPAPPFGVYVATFALTSLGQAYQDTHVNTFVAGSSSSAGAHRWLGFIHAAYMAGCLAGPFASSAIASTAPSGSSESAPSRWWLFYTVPLGLGLANMALVFAAFRDSLPFRWGRQTDLSVLREGGHETRGPSATALVRRTLSTPSVWLLSLFFFCYLGFGVTAGGWVVEYLVDVRNGDLAHVGYVPAGFSGGCLLGRVVLPEPTHRYGERRMVFLYCVCCLVFQLVFWLVPNIIAASVAISLLGFFSGPFFATAISVGSRLFPPDISATAISFVFVFAQVGGSLFPIVTGVLGSHLGVGVMQPVLVGLIVATTVSWLLVPQPPKEKQ